MKADLLFKYFSGIASESDKKSIGEWLAKLPKARIEYERSEFLFEGSVLYGPESVPAIVQRNRKRPLLRCLTAASVAALFFLAGLHFGGRRLGVGTDGGMMSIQTLPGERASVTLSDGTLVRLNACTRIDYPVRFGNGLRNVSLRGEAFFEVAHEPGRPFVVSTFASDIRVLGTRFNVLADEATGTFSTVLTDGKVEVTGKRDGASVSLAPGESVILDDGVFTKRAVSDPAALCWLDGNVDLKADSFATLLHRLEVAFGVRIIPEMEELPPVNDLTGQLRISDGIEHALKALRHVLDFNFTFDEESQTIIIQGN